MKWKLFYSIPSIISAVKKERKFVNELIGNEKIDGLISDNRFGVYSKKIPSVYITHQLNVLSGITTFITSKIHQKIIQKFDECWVPDMEKNSNLSGALGHLKNHKLSLKYIGIVSRFQPKKTTAKYDLLVLLSGPEPQREALENKLLTELISFKGSILVVRGVLTKQKSIVTKRNLKIVDYLLSKELESAINHSTIVMSRSGYSTIMDLAVLGKKAFFIPTPGQFEQEYLANSLNEKRIAPFCKQQDFSIDKLDEIKNYSGFKCSKTTVDLELFELFDSK
jgi:predicted glycosyltransferase